MADWWTWAAVLMVAIVIGGLLLYSHLHDKT